MQYTFTGIHHVQLAAPPDTEATARQFYGEVLGLPSNDTMLDAIKRIARSLPHICYQAWSDCPE